MVLKNRYSVTTGDRVLSSAVQKPGCPENCDNINTGHVGNVKNNSCCEFGTKRQQAQEGLS